MKNIWILAKANLRKSKSQTFSMGILIFAVAILLNIGLVTMLGVGNFFEDKAEELNAPHFVSIHTKYSSQGEELEFLRNFPGVTEVETTSVILGAGGVRLGENFANSIIIIAPKTGTQTMNPPHLIGNYNPLHGNAIYVPHFMILQGGLSLGDELRVEILGETLYFTVAGGTAEIMYGDGMMDMGWRLYVSEEKFASLSLDFPNGLSYMHSARMESGSSRDMGADYRAQFAPEFGSQAVSFEAVAANRTFMPTIISEILVAFAGILLIVGSVVLRFRISSDITEEMTNIGVLKAIGYNSRQIKRSILLQFSLIAIVGSIIGSIIGQFLVAPTVSVFEPLTGLPWSPAFNPLVILVSIAIIMLIVLLFTVITTRRIGKLQPLTALRGGINTHNFKKNHFALDKSVGSLGFLLTIKQIFQNVRQSVSVFIIVVVLSLFSVTGVILFYNTGVDMTAFVHLMVGEIPDYAVIAQEPLTAEQIAEMEAHADIEMILGHQAMPLVFGDIVAVGTIWEDFARTGGYNLVTGRLPMLPNEIVVESRILSEIGSAVGEFIPVTHGDITEYFMVSGTIQAFGNQFNAEINVEGMRIFQPDFEFEHFYIYLVEGATIYDFLENEGYLIQSAISTAVVMDNMMDTMGMVFGMVAALILAVTAGIVILVLHLMIKTIILRRRRELGTQKALGFTTLQLMNQIAFGIVPAVTVGSAIGAGLAHFGFNSFFSMLLYGVGVAQSNLVTPAGGTIAVAIGIIAIAYITSMLITLRIRKISAYALVSE